MSEYTWYLLSSAENVYTDFSFKRWGFLSLSVCSVCAIASSEQMEIWTSMCDAVVFA